LVSELADNDKRSNVVNSRRSLAAKKSKSSKSKSGGHRASSMLRDMGANPTDEIMRFFGGAQDGEISPLEIESAFERIDTGDDGMLSPLEVFDATVGIFQRLCQQPQF
jgi:hypothetical protein